MQRYGERIGETEVFPALLPQCSFTPSARSKSVKVCCDFCSDRDHLQTSCNFWTTEGRLAEASLVGCSKLLLVLEVSKSPCLRFRPCLHVSMSGPLYQPFSQCRCHSVDTRCRPAPPLRAVLQHRGADAVRKPHKLTMLLALEYHVLCVYRISHLISYLSTLSR